MHSHYTGPVWNNGAFLHRGSSPNPGGTQTGFATLMYNPILGEYVNVPSTVGYHASTPVGAVPCSTNLYLNFADNPTYGTTWNTTHLIPRDCGGAAPHLAAWLDYQNMHTPTSAVLEYASGYLSYVVFQIKIPPGGGIVSSLLYYSGTAGSIAAPGGNTYQVCGTPGDDVWHCTPLLWVGNPVPLFEDTFNDGTFLTPDWEELSAASCAGCWSAAGLKAAVDIPFSSVDTQAWIAAGDPAWGDYTVMAELRYSNGPDEDIVVRHGSNSSYYNVNVHHYTDSLDIRLFAVDATGTQHNLVCCPGSLVADLAPDVTYQIQVDVRGNGLRVYFGRLGQPLSLYLDHADTSGHVTANGRIGLRGWTGTHAQEHATFDNVRIFR